MSRLLGLETVTVDRMIYPVERRGNVAPSEVPDDYADDFNEAYAILELSPKASAALSRRCLQHVLRTKAGTEGKNLADQIQEILDGRSLPTHLAIAVDSIRNIGNFAAHPMKNTASGEILPVEPGEAQWCLDTLEGLFDFYFVEPAKTQARIDGLNAKLASAGKPPIKAAGQTGRGPVN